ncbi:hypothetical protein PIB30_035136 [Stylosanthes scabra]|uniref:Uncharacterized protein n=1 Tax=Stylosanthes scabra TaxID=79078 RepID=A0ABU6UBP9_9FABA|nr:hypothetical protein [Stylosanthes scabra]
MERQNSTMNLNVATTRAKTTETFPTSIYRVPSRKLEEFKSHKNVNIQEKRLLHDESANIHCLKECVASLVCIKRLSKVVSLPYFADDDNGEKCAQYIEDHKDFQEKAKGAERNNSGGEPQRESDGYDKINVKHENNNDDKNDEEDFINEEEETVDEMKLVQQPAGKTSNIDDESVDESIEASQNSNMVITSI